MSCETKSTPIQKLLQNPGIIKPGMSKSSSVVAKVTPRELKPNQVKNNELFDAMTSF